MSDPDNTARAARQGEQAMLADLGSGLLRLLSGNLVERPWGGDWLRGYKQIADVSGSGHVRWGEAFEISAYDSDAEARQYPSQLELPDGSRLSLPALLDAHGPALLGDAFIARYGACFPLLPKTLCVKELLSVQGHPPGNTEVYIIIDAEPGATLRLGFSRDIDAGNMRRELSQGLQGQRELLDLLGGASTASALQAITAPWFATRDGGDSALQAFLNEQLADDAARTRALQLAGQLKTLYWQTLDSMNAIEVQPGQVIYNATPGRHLSDGAAPSAEVHALGNPEGRQILALEIRRPGPTFRAWDNVRFPQRAVDVDAAIEALNLRGTRPDEFICTPEPVAGRVGVAVSVDCEFFRIEHLQPLAGVSVDVPADEPHALHCIAGSARFIGADGRDMGQLQRGDSAIVPAGAGAYRVVSDAAAHVVRVTVPVH